MAKKKPSKKRKTRKRVSKVNTVSKAKTPKIEERKKLSKIPVIIVLFILAAGVIAFVTQPSFLNFSVKRAESFEEGVKLVNEVDEMFNISFSDYQNDFYYIYSHPRRDPLNAAEIDLLVKEYKKIGGEEPVTLYVNFRANLAEAEKYFKLSKKTYKGDIANYPIQCKNEPYILESMDNKETSADKLDAAMSSLMALKEKYPENFQFLGISDEWILLYKSIPEDFHAENAYNLELFNSFCGEKSQ